jgi:peptidyl-prolyl cis-trans isomerase D
MVDNKRDKPRQPTRKHLVGLRRERMYNRVLVIATIVIVAVVIGLVSWSWIQETYIDPRTIVARVEGQDITGREFQSRVRVNRQQLISSYLQNYQFYTLFGTNPELQQRALNQMSQIQYQLTPSYIGSTTINQMVDDRLIQLEAESLGIHISDAQVEQELHSLFDYFPEGTPTSAPALTAAATSTLSATQLAIVTITPTSTAIPTAEASPTAEAAAEATAAEPTIEAPTPTTEPTATALDAEGYATAVADYVTNQEDALGFSEEDLRTLVRSNLYREALFQYLTADTPTTQEQVWARHIVVEDEETAQEVLGRLNDGADWADLAAEYSLDTSNKDAGGDLGWFAFDTMVEPFAQAAFNLNIGEISEPVESSFGWHIIQVLGHEERPLGSSEWNQVRNQAFTDYVQGLRNDYEWEIFEDKWFNITPSDPDIPAQYKISQQSPNP